jgi:hypothetical protein
VVEERIWLAVQSGQEEATSGKNRRTRAASKKDTPGTGIDRSGNLRVLAGIEALLRGAESAA